ncbi:hypothetical protein JAAARDRAFT_57850 [Jaapia argillacea MUCL 33604]|uniref:Uncharacterized protein n=1 Tax=Jaapia argillacea MUCL 33604 TaxID=933084 RepID=A0A067PTD9_9AGAM|nr:hypothetical protein JAAARDRAFT_57850 [Jaapia argillacea MUCL 33604]
MDRNGRRWKKSPQVGKEGEKWLKRSGKTPGTSQSCSKSTCNLPRLPPAIASDASVRGLPLAS